MDEIVIPTLILHGRSDHMAPLRMARQMHAAIAGSVLVEVPGGHISLLTRERRRLAAEVAAFVPA